MDISIAIVIGQVLYKIACLATGAFMCFMGYRLFLAGVTGDAGDVDTRVGRFKLIIKHGAPGTFFAVLGAAVICATVYRGLDFDYTHKATQPPYSDAAAHKQPEKPKLPDEPTH